MSIHEFTQPDKDEAIMLALEYQEAAENMAKFYFGQALKVKQLRQSLGRRATPAQLSRLTALIELNEGNGADARTDAELFGQMAEQLTASARR